MNALNMQHNLQLIEQGSKVWVERTKQRSNLHKVTTQEVTLRKTPPQGYS